MSSRGPEVSGHIPVLAHEALDWLNLREDGTYVDATAGGGGHTHLVAQKVPRGTVIALDRDPHAVAIVRQRLAHYPQVKVVHANYGDLVAVLDSLGIRQVSGVLIDAGVSSMQIDNGERGFSFQVDAPLDMRMDTTASPTAAEFLQSVTRETLIDVLRRYGDVQRARRIATEIIDRRDRGRMMTTGDLVEAVRAAMKTRRIPEEVRTVFQAIRIAVNDEFRWLERGLRQAVRVLEPGGRLVVISFHSGEDRIVKNVFKEYSIPRLLLYPDGRVKERVTPILKTLTPKPLEPTHEECRANPRAHSAKLRAAERTSANLKTEAS